jgi:hypothetical protein
MENTNDSTTAGLESIALVALQALCGTKKNDVDKRTTNNTGTSSINSTSTAVPPPLPTMKATARVVTMDNTIGDDDASSTSSHTCKNSGTSPPTASMPTQQEKKTSTDPLPPPNTSVDSSATAITDDSSSKKDNSSSSSNEITIPAEEVANFSRILSDPEAWLRETERENMFGKLAPIDTNPICGGDNNKIVVQPNDVLCGRGGETNHHPGNVQYRSLVKAYQKLYLLAKRRDKPKIAQCIVVSVRGAGGRFLKRIKKSALIPATEEGPAWVDVGNTKAREKTSQALREGAPDLRENVTTTTGSSTVKNIVNLNIHTSGLVEAPHRQEHTIIPTTTPTAFEAMMELSRMPTANGSSTSSSSNNIDKDALTAKAFTAAATKLMQHPIFHQLTPSQQQEAILHELKAARASALASTSAAAAATTRTSTTTPSSATSPKIGPMMQSHYPQAHHPQHPQQHRYPPFAHEQHSYYQRDQYGHPYQTQYGTYPHDVNRNRSNSKDIAPVTNANTNTNTTSIPPFLNGRKVDIQSMYREVLVAKAAAAAMDSSGTTSNAKKRPAPSSSSSSSRRLMSPPTIVSDTGSEASSLSSSSSNSLTNTSNNNMNNNNKDKNNAVVNGGGTGGPRLKRFKSRLKDGAVN